MGKGITSTLIVKAFLVAGAVGACFFAYFSGFHVETAAAGGLALDAHNSSSGPFYSLRYDADPGYSAAAMQVDITYDAAHFAVGEVFAGDAVVQGGKEIMFNEVEPGRLRLIAAGLNDDTIPSGEIGRISFLRLQDGADPPMIDSETALISDFYGNPIQTTVQQPELNDSTDATADESKHTDNQTSASSGRAPSDAEMDVEKMTDILVEALRENDRSLAAESGSQTRQSAGRARIQPSLPSSGEEPQLRRHYAADRQAIAHETGSNSPETPGSTSAEPEVSLTALLVEHDAARETMAKQNQLADAGATAGVNGYTSSSGLHSTAAFVSRGGIVAACLAALVVVLAWAKWPARKVQ